MPAPIRAHRDDDQPVVEVAPGIRARVRIGGAHGAQTLTVADRWLEDGAEIPLHHHPPGVEEAVWVVAGEAEFTVGGETAVVGPDHTVIVRAGTPHRIVSRGAAGVHILSRYSSGAPVMVGDGIAAGTLEIGRSARRNSRRPGSERFRDESEQTRNSFRFRLQAIGRRPVAQETWPEGTMQGYRRGCRRAVT